MPVVVRSLLLLLPAVWLSTQASSKGGQVSCACLSICVCLCSPCCHCSGPSIFLPTHSSLGCLWSHTLSLLHTHLCHLLLHHTLPHNRLPPMLMLPPRLLLRLARSPQCPLRCGCNTADPLHVLLLLLPGLTSRRPHTHTVYLCLLSAAADDHTHTHTQPSCSPPLRQLPPVLMQAPRLPLL